MDGCLLISEVKSTMSIWSSGTLETVNPSGMLFPWAGDILLVGISHRFHLVALSKAFLASAIPMREEEILSCKHAHLRIGEKGHPGASGMLECLRKTTVAWRWLVKVSFCASERA